MIVKLTGTVLGVLVAPGAEMVMTAGYLPLDIPAMFTVAVTESCSPVELPLGGDRVSQTALSLTDQLSVPPPEFQICNV